MAYPNYYNGGYFPQYQNGAVPDMLNQYKGQYQQPQIQNQQPFSQPFSQPIQQPMTMQLQTNDMIWVLSEVEAQSYPVAPNNSVILWDKNNDVVYIKSVNMQGVPSMRILDYVERSDNAQKPSKTHVCTCGDRFIPIEKFNELEAKFDELRAKVESLEKPKTMPKNKKVEENNDGE